MDDKEFRDRAMLAALPGVIQANAILYATLTSQERGPWEDIFPEVIVQDVMDVVEKLTLVRRASGG